MIRVNVLLTSAGLGCTLLSCLPGCGRATKPTETAVASSPAEGAATTVTSRAGSARPGDGAPDAFHTELGDLRVVPIEHGSFRLELGDRAIYVDPADAKRFEGAKPADLVLVTDIHGDHFDEAALSKVVGPTTRVIAPAVVAEKYPRAVPMKNGEHRQELGVGIEAVPMYNLKHGPGAGQLYHDKGRGNGYVLTFGKARVYVSGDTECTPEMRALRDIDVAFVCMNLPYTMSPEEAAACVNAFHPKVVYPFHYRGSDLAAFQKAVTAPGTEVRLRDWYP